MVIATWFDILFSLLAIMLVVVAVLLVRRRLSTVLIDDADPVVAASAAIVAVYGLILGLTLAAAWDRYQKAEETLNVELNGIYALARMAATWTGGEGERLQQDIVAYGEAVIANELTGAGPERIDGAPARIALERTYATLSGITQGPGGQLNVTGTAWTTLTAIDGARGIRLMLTGEALPRQFWVVLLAGGVLSILALALVIPRNGGLHLATTLGATLLIVLTLVLLRDLDQPFEGSSTIDLDSYRRGIEVLKRSLAEGVS